LHCFQTSSRAWRSCALSMSLKTCRHGGLPGTRWASLWMRRCLRRGASHFAALFLLWMTFHVDLHLAAAPLWTRVSSRRRGTSIDSTVDFGRGCCCCPNFGRPRSGWSPWSLVWSFPSSSSTTFRAAWGTFHLMSCRGPQKRSSLCPERRPRRRGSSGNSGKWMGSRWPCVVVHVRRLFQQPVRPSALQLRFWPVSFDKLGTS